MQTTNFIKYISKPATIQLMAESEAVSLVKEFPYCQSGQVLLALHLNKSNHLLFEQQLKKSAVYSSDRKKLFDLISITKEEVKANIEVVDDPKLIITKSIIELDTQPTPIEKIVLATEFVADEKSEKEKLLELEYINQAISNSYTIELEEEETEDRSQKSEDRSQKSKVRSQKTEDGSEKLEDFDENSELTFSDWLKRLPSSDKKTDKNVSQHKKIKLDLIDKFIQEDPKIKPKKTEFYSPINMARLSVVDDSDLVSETLALIQVEQGNYEEAIKTYQKLSLKNPEKRSYFANQIKILKQKIK
ncbi:MAG: hypothetical protein HYU68_01660 [Bacteroidetes bacterium]|nr:hypothetical protein [Bacteroidota bacterium]